MDLQEFRISDAILGDAAEMQRRLDEEGYLFFRHLQDPDELAALRLEILEVCRREGGWILPDTNLADGIADISQRCTEGNGAYTPVYHEVYRLESFHRAGHASVVMDLMTHLIGGPVMAHPQKIARLWFPQYTDHTTPAHQDFVHFQGAYRTYTCWIPLSRCPVELGGLALQPGSHKIDAVHDHHFSLGAGSLAVDEEIADGAWVTTNYELGDTLVFHSLTVHQALPSLTPDLLRVSLDNRYSSPKDPISAHMLEPHLSRLSPLPWEKVYADWQTTDLQYYWRDEELNVIPKDESFSTIGFEDALSKASAGDAHALFYTCAASLIAIPPPNRPKPLPECSKSRRPLKQLTYAALETTGGPARRFAGPRSGR